MPLIEKFENVALVINNTPGFQAKELPKKEDSQKTCDMVKLESFRNTFIHNLLVMIEDDSLTTDQCLNLL